MYWQVTTSDPQKSSIDGRAEDEEVEEEEKVTEQHFVFGEWRKICMSECANFASEAEVPGSNLPQ